MSRTESVVYNNAREKKHQGRGERFFGNKTRELMHYLNSEVFLQFLNELTGIEEALIGDPYFEGGGQHETKRGGYLKIHADFNKHRKLGLDRRLNVLIYLNKEWDDSYGGFLELWDRKMQQCVVRVAPIFNRMVIFETDDSSFHGLPDPITCPSEVTRKSLALYYYSNGRAYDRAQRKTEEHGTLFVSRPFSADDRRANSLLSDPAKFVKKILPSWLVGSIRNVKRQYLRKSNR